MQSREFNFEKRTLEYSKKVVLLVKSHERAIQFKSILDQLLRSATSIGANYIEANDALGKKDFIMRLKIARKEAKETIYWLELLRGVLDEDVDYLIEEAIELKNILSSMIIKISK